MAHRALGQHRVRRVLPVRAVAVVHRRGAGQGAEPVGLQVGGGIDGVHARHACAAVVSSR